MARTTDKGAPVWCGHALTKTPWSDSGAATGGGRGLRLRAKPRNSAFCRFSAPRLRSDLSCTGLLRAALTFFSSGNSKARGVKLACTVKIDAQLFCDSAISEPLRPKREVNLRKGVFKLPEDRICRSGLSKGFGLFVVFYKVSISGGLVLSHRGEASPANGLVGDPSEEPC